MFTLWGGIDTQRVGERFCIQTNPKVRHNELPYFKKFMFFVIISSKNKDKIFSDSIT